ncbi:unnamed protein product, partial [marine sediment metagenome]
GLRHALAYNAVHPADTQVPRQNGLHGIFKSDVPVHRFDWRAHDNVGSAVLFYHPEMTP